MEDDILKRARTNIAKLGSNELKIIANDESLQELFAQKQALLIEMNNAKRKAAEEAAKPYLETISELDKMYAVLLTMLQ